MKMAVSALLLGASLLAAAPASAAEFVKYTITAYGTYTRESTYQTAPTTTTAQTGFFDLTFILPAVAKGTLSANSNPYSSDERVAVANASATGLSFSTQQSADEARNFVTFYGGASLCGDFSAGIPNKNFAADSSCSTARFTGSGGRAGLYFAERFSGTVSFFQADPLIAEDPQQGYIGITAVPEPATWAMMLVGFGMLGVALRGRTRKTAQVHA